MVKGLILACCALLFGCSKPSGAGQESLEAQAEAGGAFAQCKLGAMYASGTGVPKDDAKAFGWFQKAAIRGDARAQGALGAMYASGLGVARDEAKAVEWLRRAAVHGNAFAQRQLGVMYAERGGMPKDWVRAYAWFNLAATNGDEIAAHARDVVDQRLTLEERADARKLTVELSGEMRLK